MFFRPTVEQLSESETLRAAVRGSCRNLLNFLRHAWPHLPRADGELVLAQYIPVLCEYLQAAFEKKVRADGVPLTKLLFNLPPETLKSMLFSVVFPAWCWSRDPSIGILSVCYDKDLGARDASDSRALMESPWFRVLWPEVEMREDTNAKSNYRSTAGGARLATTYRGRITGEHPRFFIWDDPLNVRDDEDGRVKKALRDFYKKRVSTRGRTKGIVHIVVGQRVSVDDPSSIAYEDNEKARQKGKPEPWTIVKFPMRYDSKIAMRRDYGFGCDEREEGELLDPVRLPEHVVESMETDLGHSAAAQLQQNPEEMQGNLFNMDYWQECDEDEVPELDEVCRYWDKAATPDESGCQTAGVLVGRKDTTTRHGETISDFYYMHVHSGFWDVDKVEDEIEVMKDLDLVRFGFDKLVVAMEEEGGSGGKLSVRSTEKRMRGVRFEAVSPGGKSKPKRAQPLARDMRRGRVWFVRGPWLAELKAQFQRFPSGLIDQADASAGGHLVLEGTLGKPKKKRNAVMAGLEGGVMCSVPGCCRPCGAESDYCCEACETAAAFDDPEMLVGLVHSEECRERATRLT